MKNLLKKYKYALNEIYKHVGFNEGYVIYPIDDQTDKFWSTDGEMVYYADSKEEYLSESGNYYEDFVHMDHSYYTSIYEGDSFVMIFCNSQVDRMLWFKIFDKSKKM